MTNASHQLIDRQLRASAAPHHISRYRQLKLLGEFDKIGGWAHQGFTSCANWWAAVAGIEPSTAREQVRVARAMRSFPDLDRAVQTGRLTYAKAKIASRGATDATIRERIELAIAHPAGHFSPRRDLPPAA